MFSFAVLLFASTSIHTIEPIPPAALIAGRVGRVDRHYSVLSGRSGDASLGLGFIEYWRFSDTQAYSLQLNRTETSPTTGERFTEKKTIGFSFRPYSYACSDSSTIYVLGHAPVADKTVVERLSFGRDIGGLMYDPERGPGDEVFVEGGDYIPLPERRPRSMKRELLWVGSPPDTLISLIAHPKEDVLYAIQASDGQIVALNSAMPTEWTSLGIAPITDGASQFAELHVVESAPGEIMLKSYVMRSTYREMEFRCHVLGAGGFACVATDVYGFDEYRTSSIGEDFVRWFYR